MAGAEAAVLERPADECLEFAPGEEEALEALRALLERCWAEAPRDRPGFEAIGEVLRGLRASVARGTEARAEP